MALSSLTFASRGVGPYPLNGLDYLSTAHLTALVDGTPVSATFDDAKKQVTLAAAAGAAAVVVIQRATPRRQEERLTQFPDIDHLAAGDLDTDYRQTMLINGEGRDLANAQPDLSGMGLDAGMQWDAQGKRVENLAPGSAPSDMLRKDQMDTADTTVRNLPAVTGADNDDGLFVSGGEWAKRTPVQSRAHLGLGTAAVLNVGTGANNALQFSSDAFPRYPTADGRNIDLTNHPIQAEIAKRALATAVYLTRFGITYSTGTVTTPTWTQSATGRISFAPAWAGRVELNNSGDVDGSVANNGIVLAAGTYRVRWTFNARQTGASCDAEFALTNNDDTSSQTVFFRTGVDKIIRQFNAGQSYYWAQQYQLVLGSPGALVFRFLTNGPSGGNNTFDMTLYIHKISASVIA